MLNKLRIRQRILTFYILVGLVPLLVISVLSYLIAQSITHNEVYNRIDTFLELKKESIDSYFSEQEHMGRSIAQSRLVMNYVNQADHLASETLEDPEIMAYLKASALAESYHDIQLHSLEGRILLSIDSTHHSDQQIDTQLQKVIENDSLQWSPIYQAAEDKHLVLALMVPVHSPQNEKEIIGGVSFIIPAEQIDEIVHKHVDKIGMTGDAYIVNETGLLYTNTLLSTYTENAALVHSINTVGTDMLSEALFSENHTFTTVDKYIDYRENMVLGAIGVIPFGNRHAGLLIELDYEEAYAQVILLRNAMVFGLLLMIALSLFMTVVTSQDLVHPIERLEEGANRIAQGDLSHRIPIQGSDEITSCSIAFNSMCTTLNQTLLSKRRVDAVFNQISEAIIVTDTSGAVQFMNNVATQLTDVDLVDCMYCDIREVILVDPPTIDLIAPIQKAMSAGETYTTAEFTVASSKRGHFPAHCNFSIIQTAGNDSKEFLIVIRDISEKRAYEEALQDFAARPDPVK